jgi:hypothetical protein
MFVKHVVSGSKLKSKRSDLGSFFWGWVKLNLPSEINPPLKDEGKTKNECRQCYIDADDNVQKA